MKATGIERLLDRVLVRKGEEPGRVTIWFPSSVSTELRDEVCQRMQYRWPEWQRDILDETAISFLEGQVRKVLKWMANKGELARVDGEWRLKETK